MKLNIKLQTLFIIFILCNTFAFSQEGEPYIHDPSTVILCDGKYYTFGTGGGGLISEDGWIWHGGAVRPGGGVGEVPHHLLRVRELVLHRDGRGSRTH